MAEILNLKGEVGRKLMHLAILIIPIVYFYTNIEFTKSILIPVTIFGVLLDILRFKIKPVKIFFNFFFSWMLREHEQNQKFIRLTGATHTMLAASIGIFFIPKEIFLLAFSVLAVSDTAASFVGRFYGKRKLFNKTLEGSLAFLFTGIILVLVTPKFNYSSTEYFLCFVGIIFGTIVESLPLPVDDNFVTPLAISLFLMLLYNLTIPNYLI